MLKKLLKKIVYQEKADSESFIKWMRSKGAKVGERTTIFAPNKTIIDMTRPWLLNIGNDVQITEGVTILTHGYDWSVLKGVYGDILGSGGAVTIGNNVFIGMHSTILKGVHVGNNVIIGANSLVNKDIPDNCVAGGNPCKVIMALDEYYEKRKKAQLAEATELVNMYRNRYKKEPNKSTLNEFFWLFSDGKSELPDCWNNVMKLVGNYSKSKEKLSQNEKMFQNMEDFLKHI